MQVEILNNHAYVELSPWAIAKCPAQVYPTMGDEVKDELDPISSRDKQRVVDIPTS